MEADWSAEIGPGLPVMDAAWDGLVDLRSFRERIESIEQARQHPAMRQTLLALNASPSPVFTTKCDCWTLPAADIDPDEFAATCDTARTGFASYIDVVDRDLARFASFEVQERRARTITSALRSIHLSRARIDLVIRAAVLRERDGFGITLYAAACGAADSDAYAALGKQRSARPQPLQ